MTVAPPFDRTDLPHQTRILGGAIADVYAAIADVTAWPRWVPGLVDPVIIKGQDSFFYRTRSGERVQPHEGVVIVRGPTHTFGVQLHEGRLWFRTRPNPPGTKVDVVFEPRTARRLGRLFGTRRRHARRQSWLNSVLDGLVDQLRAGWLGIGKLAPRASKGRTLGSSLMSALMNIGAVSRTKSGRTGRARNR